jgi:hypothetical protein
MLWQRYGYTWYISCGSIRHKNHIELLLVGSFSLFAVRARVFNWTWENLGCYACSNIQTKSNFDFGISKWCSGQLDYSHQNGRPEKKQFEQRKINSPSTCCIIITILLSDDVHINPGPIKYPCTNCKKGKRSNLCSNCFFSGRPFWCE